MRLSHLAHGLRSNCVGRNRIRPSPPVGVAYRSLLSRLKHAVRERRIVVAAHASAGGVKRGRGSYSHVGYSVCVDVARRGSVVAWSCRQCATGSGGRLAGQGQGAGRRSQAFRSMSTAYADLDFRQQPRHRRRSAAVPGPRRAQPDQHRARARHLQGPHGLHQRRRRVWRRVERVLVRSCLPAAGLGRRWTGGWASASPLRSTGSSAPSTCSSISRAPSRPPTTTCSRSTIDDSALGLADPVQSLRELVLQRRGRLDRRARQDRRHLSRHGRHRARSVSRKTTGIPLTLVVPDRRSPSVRPNFWNRHDGTTNFCGPTGLAPCATEQSRLRHDRHPGASCALDTIVPKRLGSWYFKASGHYYHIYNDALLAAQTPAGIGAVNVVPDAQRDISSAPAASASASDLPAAEADVSRAVVHTRQDHAPRRPPPYRERTDENSTGEERRAMTATHAQARAVDADRLERLLRLRHQHPGQHAGADRPVAVRAEDAELAGVRPHPAGARPDDVPVHVLLRVARLSAGAEDRPHRRLRAAVGRQRAAHVRRHLRDHAADHASRPAIRSRAGRRAWSGCSSRASC